MSRRILLALAAGSGVAALTIGRGAQGQGAGRSFTDAAGRSINLRGPVRRVFPAGPPAAVLLYTLAPEMMTGWVHAPSSEESAYLAPTFRDLPARGQLTGRGNTASIEAVLATDPDLILDVGEVDGTYVSLAQRVQQQTGIPYVLLDGSFDTAAQTYRTLGAMLGLEARAERLAAYADQVRADVRAQLARTPELRPRVYYGRGPEGLETGGARSINTELLGVVGAVNVAGGIASGGVTNVSLEQVLAWNPDVIIARDERFYASLAASPLWAGLDAVRAGRFYRPPSLPFGWFDSPPSVNRLIGVRWLTQVLYPDAPQTDLRAATREFYAAFYHVDLSDALLDALLRGALTSPG